MTEYAVFLFVLVAVIVAVAKGLKGFIEPMMTQRLEEIGSNMAGRAVHTYPFRP